MGGKETFLRLDAKIRNCVRTRVNAQPKENKEKKEKNEKRKKRGKQSDL
jgi:hypothetical protein